MTEAGRLFHEHAERIIRETERATQTIRELAGAEHGRLTIGTIATVNSYLIPPVVCRLKQRFPNVHVHVHAQPSSGIVENLLETRLDLGLCLLPASHDKLVTIRLFHERLSLVASPDFPRLGRRLRMKDLAALPLVLFCRATIVFVK